MENKINILTLSESLASLSGKPVKLCEDFLKEFFKLSAETLEATDVLKIKGFGTFKVVDTPVVRSDENGNSVTVYVKRVSFTASKELADEINLPFGDFESIEIDDDMPEEEITGDENLVSNERLEEGSDEEGSDDIITYEAYTYKSAAKEAGVPRKEEPIESPTEEPVKEEKSEIPVKEANGEKKEKKALPVEVVSEVNVKPAPQVIYQMPKEGRFGVGLLIGALSTFCVCLIIFILGCFFHWWPVNFGKGKEIVTEKVEISKDEPANKTEETQEDIKPVEEIVAVETPVEKVYDTVTKTRYLTTIAREHYGNYNFWPYIYIENAEILGHPDRITPGTKVVVPDLSKFGVDVANKEDVETAKKMGREIYSRYK